MGMIICYLLISILAFLLRSSALRNPLGSGFTHCVARHHDCRTGPGRWFVASNSQGQEDDRRRQIRELAGPLMDERLIKEIIDTWTRPLPQSALSSPLVLSGPSGVGKNRLVTQLLKDYGKFFKKVVTHTTRSPRFDEVDAINYHFTTKEAFERLSATDFFIEYSRVHGNWYGLSREALRNVTSSGKIAIVEIDVQGTRKLKFQGIAKQHGLSPRYLFIAPASIDALKSRLIERGTETPDDMELRLSNAVGEVATAETELGLFDRILVNNDFEETSRAFFRTCRDWYPTLPAPSRLRMLQRRIAKIKRLSREGHDPLESSS